MRLRKVRFIINNNHTFFCSHPHNRSYMLKKLTSFFILFIITITPLTVKSYTLDFEVVADTVILENLDTNTRIYTKNLSIDELKYSKKPPADNPDRRYPASLTKIMTAIIVLENAVDLDEKVTVTEDALNPLLGTGVVTAALIKDEEVKIRDMLYMILVMSGADAANALAIRFGGSFDGFVKLMNDRAKALGMHKTHFTNAHGLHDDNHYSTAEDIFIMAKHALTLPLFADIVKSSSYKFEATNKHQARSYQSTNFMLLVNDIHYYEPIKGIKTGFTAEAGRCLLSIATKDGYNYMALIMGTPDNTVRRNRQEFTDTRKLYEWAFKNLRHKTIATSNEVMETLPLKNAWGKDTIQLIPAKELIAILPKDRLGTDLNPKFFPSSPEVYAPVKKGDVLGYMEYRYGKDNEVIGRVDLVAAESIDRNFFAAIFASLSKFFSGPIFITLMIIAALLIITLITINIITNNRRKRLRNLKRIKKQ